MSVIQVTAFVNLFLSQKYLVSHCCDLSDCWKAELVMHYAHHLEYDSSHASVICWIMIEFLLSVHQLRKSS